MKVIHTTPKDQPETPEIPGATLLNCGCKDIGDMLMWTGSVAALLKELISEAPGELHLSGAAKDGLFCLLDGITHTLNTAQ